MLDHHGCCPNSLAWDIPDVPCDCPPGWPRKAGWQQKPMIRVSIWCHYKTSEFVIATPERMHGLRVPYIAEYGRVERFRADVVSGLDTNSEVR